MSVDISNDAPTPAESTVRRHRRWLIAYALLGLATVTAVAGVRVFAGDDSPDRSASAKTVTPVVVQRFELKRRGGGSTRGLVEVLRRGEQTDMRMIAVKLRPTVADEVYQVVLVGGGEDRVLGAQTVDRSGTFLARADITAEELLRHRRIELQRVGSADAEGRVVLQARIR